MIIQKVSDDSAYIETERELDYQKIYLIGIAGLLIKPQKDI